MLSRVLSAHELELHPTLNLTGLKRVDCREVSGPLGYKASSQTTRLKLLLGIAIIIYYPLR